MSIQEINVNDTYSASRFAHSIEDDVRQQAIAPLRANSSLTPPGLDPASSDCVTMHEQYAHTFSEVLMKAPDEIQEMAEFLGATAGKFAELDASTIGRLST